MKALGSLLRLSLIIVIVGATFKWMHWPGANIMLVIGTLSLCLLYPTRFFLKTEKNTLDYIKLFLVLTWGLNILNQTFHFIDYKISSMASVPFFVAWILMEGVAYLDNLERKKILATSLLGIILILTGFLFSILHWHGQNIILLTGSGIFITALLKDALFASKKEVE